MVMMSPTQIHWVRQEIDMVDFSFVRHYCQWYREPNIGCILKLVRFYKPIDLPVNAPMLSHEIFLSLCPSISRGEFDDVASRCYNRQAPDRGAEKAYNIISESYDLVSIFRDEWGEDSELKKCQSISSWDGSDVRGIQAADVRVLRETLDAEHEWLPTLSQHPSWGELRSS